MPMKGRGNNNDSARSGSTTELGMQIMANLASGELVGERIQSLARTIKNMKGIFRDEQRASHSIKTRSYTGFKRFTPSARGRKAVCFGERRSLSLAWSATNTL